MPGRRRDEDAGEAVTRALQEAQAAERLDDEEVARRLNLACGTSIIKGALWRCWVTGADIPDAATFIRAVRLAGAEAERILSSLS